MEKQERKKKAIVIGAGVGGTATAARLACAGFDVDVYEKNEFSGGRCSLIRHEGYRFDQGPSLLLLPPIFRRLYADLGTTLEQHIDLIKCDPNYLVHFHDGETVELSTDRARLRAEVEKWEGPQGGEGLEGFLQYVTRASYNASRNGGESGKHAALSYSLVLSKTFTTYLSLLRPSFLLNAINLHPHLPLWNRVSRYFKTERMRRAFSFGSMYLGSSPFEAPGTYSLLQWTETVEGIWYPRGGVHQVVQSLINIVTSHSAHFHFSHPVSHVRVNASGKANGVVFCDGTEASADVVVVNADLAWAHGNLFRDSKGGGRRDPRLARRLEGKPHSCSSISFYWAMDRQFPELQAHNIFLAEEYKESFDDIFRRSSMPREPSFYVNVPSRIDPSAAPEGKDSLTILVPIGHMLLEDHRTPEEWTGLVAKARAQVMEVMEGRLEMQKGELDKAIVWEDVNTPVTWKEKFNLTHGSILGISHDFFNVLAFRHQARHPSVKNAYFVGASVHPGTGVPIAIAGSRLCAEAVMNDMNIPLPASYDPAPVQPRNKLDVMEPARLQDKLEDWAGPILWMVLGALLALLYAAMRML
ncbi:hypothetical protein QFC20_006250 [Naganishia adeliensis]|uniref:Uncharacterized protein n=1 Tax=Naganishia adeliensis TaxID=92952 RepID=A0ACC2VFJ4_9TREE|nr:hypothetical protein QFC20_006250 [Naganishia adeliensis]